MRKLFKILIVCVVLLLIASGLLLFSHRYLYPKSAIAEGTSDYSHKLQLITYNTHRMGNFRKPKKNEVIQYLLACDADVICLQEVEVYHDEQYLTEADLLRAFRKYPYSYVGYKISNSRRKFGNAIFSKYPLINKRKVEYDSRSNGSLVADVVVRGDTIRLINNHLESMRIESRDIDSVVQSRSIHSGRLEEKIRYASSVRHKQAVAVHEEIEQSPYPIIVLGDLNSLPLSWTYLTVRNGLKDCFLRCSNLRIGATMNYLNLPFRIDYVFCSEELEPWGFEVDRIDASDHYPIRATIVW